MADPLTDCFISTSETYHFPENQRKNQTVYEGPNQQRRRSLMEFAAFIKTPKIDRVTLQETTSKKVECSLCITGHHLILSTRKEEEDELWLLHSSIDQVEKIQLRNANDYIQATRDWINNPNQTTNTGNSSGGIITLYCKNLRIFKIEIENNEDFLNVADSIDKLSKLDVEWLYPFFYMPVFNVLEDGYTIFKPEMEYTRLIATGQWRLTRINEQYKVCQTYGKSLLVPQGIQDEDIVESAAFREDGRFPVFCYKHNDAILMRASPISSQNGIKRCPADEMMINIVLGRTSKGFILDTCKPGKGNIPSENYTQWKKVLQTIKITPDCLAKLMDACNDIECSTDQFLDRLEKSMWLSLVLKTLNVACIVAQCLDKEKTPVLIQGTDAALLVSALVQIILNPDCRTVRGFIALIDREFIQGGYPFKTRHRHGCYSSNRSKQSTPSFLLFLDCVYQLHYQFCGSFEFKTQLLLMLFENSYFSQYGTFLGDNEQERDQLQVNSKTTSYWTHLFRPEVMNTILSPIYEPNPGVIWPSVAPCSLVLWSELYLRWKIDQKYERKMQEDILNIINKQKKLRPEALRLRKELLDLHKEYNAVKDNVSADDSKPDINT